MREKTVFIRKVLNKYDRFFMSDSFFDCRIIENSENVILLTINVFRECKINACNMYMVIICE
ncbi:MAG: hypothetical protein CVU11_11080 [Bacteroidetes bacterium HGW-Bacteroidetes-6]|nr:MAG: hypothetical protein CVU11_11080 [Bacteroidetes bacterium HGW-Bacteroidetes-6]